MLEIELKILNVNIKKITQKLLSLGAQQAPRELYIEEAFDFPDQRIKKNNQLCRLRQQGNSAKLTFKNKKQNQKQFRIAEEMEITVDNFQTAKKILENLGLSSYRHREKYRTKFRYNNVEIELDEHPSIPPYMEIEGSKKDIRSTLLKLDYTMADTTTMTATEVLKKYGQFC